MEMGGVALDAINSCPPVRNDDMVLLLRQGSSHGGSSVMAPPLVASRFAITFNLGVLHVMRWSFPAAGVSSFGGWSYCFRQIGGPENAGHG